MTRRSRRHRRRAIRRTMRGGMGNAINVAIDAANSALRNAGSGNVSNPIERAVKISPDGQVVVGGATPTLTTLFTLFRDQPDAFFKHLQNFPVTLDTGFIMLIDEDKRRALIGPATTAKNAGWLKRKAATVAMSLSSTADKIINGIKPIAQDVFGMSDELLEEWKAAYLRTDKGKLFDAGVALANQFLQKMNNMGNM